MRPSAASEQDSSDRFLPLLEGAAGKLLAVREPGRLIQELFAVAAAELGLDVYFNYLLTQDGDLRLASSTGIPDDMVREGAVLKLGSAVCGCVARDRQPRHVTDLQSSEDPQTAFIKRAGLQVYACTPMLVGDRVIGTLGFGRRAALPFTPDELQFLRTLTAYLTVAQERLRTETALRESERRLNAVLNNASVAIFLMDERHQCSFMNAAAEHLTGYSFAETQGRTLHEVVHHTHPDGRPYPIEDCPIDRAFPENHNQKGEEIFVHRDGHFYPVAFTASPVHDDASNTIGTIIEVTDISEHKRNQEARELLMHEVDHRARNALAVAQSIIELTSAPDIKAYRTSVTGRVAALARAQGSLAAEHYEGASIRGVIEHEMATLGRTAQYEIVGPDWMLSARQVQPLAMLIHELATNATKHGALSRKEGSVRVRLSRNDRRAHLDWKETGGPPVSPPANQGFGSRLIRQLTNQLDGESALEWRAQGLVARLSFPERG